MQTALLASKIATKLVMVWATVSTTVPVAPSSPNSAVLAVYRPTICNQVGKEYEVTTADVEWNGKTVTVEIGREATGKSEQRSVDCTGNALY